MITRRVLLQSAAAAAAYSVRGSRTARAENAPGVTDTEIKIGQTMPYSGPLSSYGVIGRTETAYFKMINEQGGVNGRKITLISVDDAYSPPKTVEQVRRLVESEKVAFLFNTLGTATKYRDPAISTTTKRCRSSSSLSGAGKVERPQEFSVDNRLEARTTGSEGAHLRQAHSGDQVGRKDRGALSERRLRQGLPDGIARVFSARNAGMIVKEASYETSEPTVNSQVVTLQGSGADIFIIAATPKFAAQAIRKSFDLGWNGGPLSHAMSRPSIATVLKPAGLDKSKRPYHRGLHQRRERPAMEGGLRT